MNSRQLLRTIHPFPQPNEGNAMLVMCKCQHAGQDALNGPGVRVANELKRKDAGPLQARCTVCSAIHEVRGPAAESSKADKKKAKKEATQAAVAAK